MANVFLVATDATEAALPALRAALQLASVAGATVLALHVVETPTDLGRWSASIARNDTRVYKRLLAKQVLAAERRVRQQVATAGEASGIVEVKVMAGPGRVADSVLKIARSLEVSLIVIGKGRDPGALAAVADRIARVARRPVLIVPATWTRRVRTRVAPVAQLRRPRRPAARASAR